MYSMTFRVRRYAVNLSCAPIVNPPNRVQGTPYHPLKLHPGACSSVGMRPQTDTQTDRHTDARNQYTFRVF